jgi:hypothetical protein
VEGFGWAEVEQLSEPMGPTTAVAWLVAAAAVVASALTMAFAVRGWWIVTGLAALVSQVMVFTSWSDAKVGTVANALMLCAAGYGFLRDGPGSFRAEYHRHVAAALAAPVGQAPLVTERDLEALPGPVAAYLRRSGAVGQPRIHAFRAKIAGRIRSGPQDRWMSFTGEQINTYGPHPARVFFIDAAMRGLPVDVLHVFDRDAVSMRARLCSAVPVLSAAGPELTRAETVTIFNDLCLFAPAALVGAPVDWEVVDDRRVRGSYRLGPNAVSAELVFNTDGDLVDFVSDDRLRADAGGKQFTPARWTTPVREYADFAGRRAVRRGEGMWQRPEDPEPFNYLQLEVLDLSYTPVPAPAPGSGPVSGSTVRPGPGVRP